MSKHADVYAAMFKAWPKAAGIKPTADALASVHALGLRPGKQAMANAMYLRPEGASQAQVVMVCGAPQNNKRTELCAVKKVARLIDLTGKPCGAHSTVRNEAGHTVYRIELTALGNKAVTKAATADAPKPDKPKVARKRKAKGDKPQGDAPAPQAAPEATAPQGDAPQA